MTTQILAVQRMQDYIEAHLDEPIGLDALARTAAFSPRQAYRLFLAHTGLTPARYIRRLRLARSALRLKRGEGRVVDTAFELGFGSLDGYARAFAREFGMTPGEYARHPVPVTLFVPYGVKYRTSKTEDITMSETRNIIIQTIHKPRRKVVFKPGVKAEEYFAYCGEVGCDVWGMLLSMDSLCGEPVCLWLPERLRRPSTSTYVQGVEAAADSHPAIPEGFEEIELPEADYLRFQGEPFAEENFGAAIAEVQQAMERYDPSAIGCEWDDENPRIQLQPRGERGYIELRAIRKKA